MNTPAVELEGVDFGWPRKQVLLKIDHLAINRGERVFLRGPSGSGKSTLLGLIGGVLAPRTGRVRLLGTDLGSMSAGGRDRFRGEHLGFIFQMFNLIPYLSVRANVLLPLDFSPARRLRIADRDAVAEAERLLGAMGLQGADLLNRLVTDLSIGQQQRVAAARALIGRPSIVIADEPTSALDADARMEFLRLLMNECRTAGATLLFVSHDAALAPLFDRILSMSDVNVTERRAA
jgi:putative ABC transport system ATP-binding protein